MQIKSIYSQVQMLEDNVHKVHILQI